MQGDRVKKLMFSYSDNVDKELKYNQYISISSIDSHASHTKEECSSEKTGIQSLENLQWRYFGDNLDGAIAKCLLCKYNPTKGDARKSSREWWKHHESQSPLGLVTKKKNLENIRPFSSELSLRRTVKICYRPLKTNFWSCSSQVEKSSVWKCLSPEK